MHNIVLFNIVLTENQLNPCKQGYIRPKDLFIFNKKQENNTVLDNLKTQFFNFEFIIKL